MPLSEHGGSEYLLRWTRADPGAQSGSCIGSREKTERTRSKALIAHKASLTANGCPLGFAAVEVEAIAG